MKILKKLTILIIAFFSFQTAKAQVEFNHSLGLTVLTSPNVAAWGFTYEPRLNLFSAGSNGNISIGTHLSANLSFNSQDASGNGLLFDFPLVAEYNGGFGSSKDNSSSFGYFAGIGYDLTSTIADANGTNATSGLMIDAGIRFTVKVPLSLRVSYLLSSKSNDTGAGNVLGIGLSYMFGMNKN